MPSQRDREKWEYMIIAIPPTPFAGRDGEEINANDVLNTWGAHGWEAWALRSDGMVFLKRKAVAAVSAAKPIHLVTRVSAVAGA